MSKKLNAIDLFSGAGGLSYGLSKSNFDIILANEIENDFAKSFSLNHPSSKMIFDDIHNIDFKQELKKLKIRKIDVLCGGPPCQGFSTVGKKNKLDKRNSLFWEFLRVVNETKPKVVLFENVSGFKRLYNGTAYLTLISELEAMGYHAYSRIINAANYGLPQKRLRTIIVAVDKKKSFKFPDITHTDKGDIFNKPYLNIMEAISDLPSLNYGESKNQHLTKPKNEYQHRMRNGQTILTEHNASNYGEKMREILRLIPSNGSVLDLPEHLRPKSYFNNVYGRLDDSRPAPTMTRNFGTPSSSRCIHPLQNRALSTREGARLQSFPDDFIFYGSKSSKNLQIGNAVPPLLGEVLGKAIHDSITK